MDWASLVDKGGTVGLLLLIIVTGIRRVWVFGWLYAEKVKEVEEWKELAKRGSVVAQKAVTVAAEGSET